MEEMDRDELTACAKGLIPLGRSSTAEDVKLGETHKDVPIGDCMRTLVLNRAICRKDPHRQVSTHTIPSTSITPQYHHPPLQPMQKTQQAPR
jgi:hypothetical protein